MEDCLQIDILRFKIRNLNNILAFYTLYIADDTRKGRKASYNKKSQIFQVLTKDGM